MLDDARKPSQPAPGLVLLGRASPQRKPIRQLINTHHHLDHTGGNRFFRKATIVSTDKRREALAPGFPPAPPAPALHAPLRR